MMQAHSNRLWLVAIFMIAAVTVSTRSLAMQYGDVVVQLKLSDGQSTKGTVQDYDDHVIVISAKGTAKTIEWERVETSSAYEAKKKILVAVRGSKRNLTAEDHFQLGYFLATRNRHSAAIREFGIAKKRDPSYGDRVQRAWKEIRRKNERHSRKPNDRLSKSTPGSATGTINRPTTSSKSDKRYLIFAEQDHREAIKKYMKMGETVKQTIAPDMVLLETRNFLIWTDWPERQRNEISDWAEDMYNQLCKQFGFPKEQPIWLGKCPIFCFRNKSRFDKFAKTFDNYNSVKSLGYCRSQSDGYVHVVLRRLGNKPADIDQFASTMVHEASHAFVHCYISPRPLPAWLNEGLAEYVAERVVPKRSHADRHAVAMGRYFISRKKSIQPLFGYKQSPPGEYYPIAYSLVDYLIRKNQSAFVELINDIKSGVKWEKALESNYKSMTPKNLERAWKKDFLRRHPLN